MSRCHARRSPRLGCGVAHPAVAAALAMLWCALAADAAAGSEYGEPKRVGTIDAPALSELSGLAASRETPGVFWVVNDGGHGARLYAISRRGTMLAQFEVPDARNRDWEALAVVSRPGRRAALYVGDIGDNAGGRDDLVIYRLPEPVVRPGGLARRTARPRVFPFRYPDGRHDAEAIAVDPRTGRIYVITKSLRGARLYRFPVRFSRAGRSRFSGLAVPLPMESPPSGWRQAPLSARTGVGSSCVPTSARSSSPAAGPGAWRAPSRGRPPPLSWRPSARERQSPTVRRVERFSRPARGARPRSGASVLAG